MSTIQVQYTDYVATIPSELAGPFKLLSSLLTHMKIEHSVELLENEATSQIVDGCILTTSVSIGTHFGGSEKLKPAVPAWAGLCIFEKVLAVADAAKRTEPYNFAAKMSLKADTGSP